MNFLEIVTIAYFIRLSLLRILLIGATTQAIDPFCVTLPQRDQTIVVRGFMVKIATVETNPHFYQAST